METKTQGPKLNKTTENFSSRDCLGIESVAASISGVLCPIINTVTPRAFYWPFMCWIYYDYFVNSGLKDRKTDVFDKGFLKKQDYYFVLANILAHNPDQSNLAGKDNAGLDLSRNPNGPYDYNPHYLAVRFGGMQYYNAGCTSMQFITDYNEETGEVYSLAHPTQLGEEMALAFEKVIKNTAYYKSYRLGNTPVPKEVLLEYAQKMQLNMREFDECKQLLRKYMFGRNHQLQLSAKFAKQIFSVAHRHDIGAMMGRYYLFDYYSARSENNDYPEELKDTVQGWEVVIGRQYFTIAIEMIWKYMLKRLDQPFSLDEWISRVLQELPEEDLNKTVESVISTCVFDFNTREAMISAARASSFTAVSVLDGIKIALFVYNRFIERADFGDANIFLDYGQSESLSLNEWVDTVDRFKKKNVQDLLQYVMREEIIQRHQRTCFEKITRSSHSVDGFYYEYIDGKYMKNEHVYQIDFQGNRMLQLMQVMKDLDMFEKNE